MTQQRKIIYDIICNSPLHMTAEQIYAEAKRMRPSIAMGTVYRNLGLMAEAGEILRIEMPGRPDHFDKTVAPHHHCVCLKCGAVSDVPIPDLTELLEKHIGSPVTGYDLTVHVLCENCKE
ncbi:MAG: transcriptional repressor [Clostridia bacterium]|nr:transcriptional repressor [Clostridia bacterium]